jgi:DNA adenine methylase
MSETGAVLQAAPFLRWAGSKRWLVPRIREMFPDTFGRYFEPFLGSGAIFFACAGSRVSHLSDTISPLINCYQQVRDHPLAVAQVSQKWLVDAPTYYEVRSTQDEDPVRQAARFIYLNKTCFNGLYRENQNGEFNVPFGRPKSSNILDHENLMRASELLQSPGTIIKVCDFEDSLKDCSEGDVVYIDPPYVAGHRQNGFVDYNAKLFGWEDQRRLASVCRDLHKRGASVIVSNASHESVRRLFTNPGFQLLEVSRYSSMAARSGKRGNSTELLIFSSNNQRRRDS